MALSWLLTLFLSPFVLLASAKSSTGSRVLAVLDPKIQPDYSIFFNQLQENGYDVTFRGPSDEKPELNVDDLIFDHVVLFTAAKSSVRDLSPQNLVQVTKKGVNLLLVVPSKQTPLSSLAAEFNIVLPPPSTPLLSYFPERGDPASVIPIPAPTDSDIIAKGLNPIWYKGLGFHLGSNPMLFPILNAPKESFAADSTDAEALVQAAEKGGEGLWAGSSLAVVAGFQTRNNARVAWSGSLELFSDEYMRKEISGGYGINSGNTQVARDIVAWAFQENNVLRIEKVVHNVVNASSSEAPELYTTNSQAVFTADITKFNPDKNTWEPFREISDLQLEFTMLDPHIRTALKPVASSPGQYSVQFRVPDRHGVFKFIIDWKRKGWTYLHSSTTVPVVPPRHDGYPRFLSAAWPYYTGAISTSIGFLLFSALWLAGESQKKTKSQKVE
ncbi:dolichyl-diphosphooligosaccharide-protein glycosyltransferase [Flagelloscypha sp. PMI_526]|nr:dolichyl-diphosphooligosaccharide-protein glycosyltransferase [Flagelloscypha sp. PMI_526]